MTQTIIKHQHAKLSWLTIRMRVDDMKTVLVIETDLSLNSAAEGYDKGAVDDLLASVRD